MSKTSAKDRQLLNLSSLQAAYRAYHRCTEDRLRALAAETETAEKSELQRLCTFLEGELLDLDREREKLLLGGNDVN